MNKIIQTEFNNPPASILDFRKIMITVICLTIIGPLLQSIDASFSNIASNDAFLHQVSWSIIVMKFISDTVIHFFVSFIFLSPLLIINMSGGISCLLLLALFRSIMNKKAPNFTRSLLALYFIISFVYLVNNHYLMINPVSFTQYGFSSCWCNYM